jgi:hypothetical protein
MQLLSCFPPQKKVCFSVLVNFSGNTDGIFFVVIQPVLINASQLSDHYVQILVFQGARKMHAKHHQPKAFYDTLTQL